jgi:hypothetical protein
MPKLDDDVSIGLTQIEQMKASPLYDERSAPQIKRAEVKVRMHRTLTESANRHRKLASFVLHYLDADTRISSSESAAPKREAFLDCFDQKAVASVEFVLELVFLQLVASVEYFLFDALRCVLVVYPESLSSTQVQLSDVISKSQQEIIDNAVERNLNEISYKRPEEYVKEISRLLRLPNAQTNTLWKKFFEIKARRDLGAHNDWIVNDQYLRKVETDLRPSVKLGERLRIDFEYFKAALDTCGKLEHAIVQDFLAAWK